MPQLPETIPTSDRKDIHVHIEIGYDGENPGRRYLVDEGMANGNACSIHVLNDSQWTVAGAVFDATIDFHGERVARRVRLEFNTPIPPKGIGTSAIAVQEDDAEPAPTCTLVELFGTPQSKGEISAPQRVAAPNVAQMDSETAQREREAAEMQADAAEMQRDAQLSARAEERDKHHEEPQKIFYSCPRADGRVVQTTTAEVGCRVIAIH
jgi:hypothetical protein